MGDRERNSSGHVFDETISRSVDDALTGAEEHFKAAIDKQVNAAVGAAISEKVSAITAERMAVFGESPAPISVRILPLIETIRLLPVDAFDDGVPDDLQDLLDNPPTLTGKATEDSDGRLVPVVLAIVHDTTGATRAGIEARLIDDSGVLLDRTRTDSTGLALLRFPNRAGNDADVTGELDVAGLDDPLDVTVPAGVQQIVVDVVLDALPDLPTVVDPETGEAISETPVGDDILERLPADFSTGLCDAISRLRGSTRDPILGKIAAPDDFRSRRTPLIKRLTVPRIGETPEGGGPPRRYLVHLRQEWMFLGYTLGELSGVEALDPGAIVQDITRTVERTVERASRAVDQVTSELVEAVRSSLTRLSSVDTLVSVATSAETRATTGLGVSGNTTTALIGGIAGGILGGPIGAVAGGLLGGLFGGARADANIGTSLFASSTTRTGVATSLQVNSFLHTAKSAVNQAIRTVASTLRDVQTTVQQQVDQVSPLLSRVTNLLRWTLYENYAVCTAVEDVVEIRSVRVTEPPEEVGAPLFSDEDIVEYRRYFEPALLEPQLRPQFAVLRDAVAQRITGGSPITVVHVAVDFSASLFGGDLRITVGTQDLNLQLRPGAAIARGSLRIMPTLPAQLQQAEIELTARPPSFSGLGIFGNIIDQILDRGGVQVSRIRLWYETTPAAAPDQTESMGETLRATNDARSVQLTLPLSVPVRLTDTTKNPLFRHVNRNRTYYFGVLAQAAQAVPSLRDDAPELGVFNGEHPLWRLPIVGFEGDRVLVIADVARDAAGEITDPDARRLLEDAGAATIIQLAAPGAYAEALQGLLELTGDIAGKIHPSLLPPLPPVVPPLALVDLTGKQLQVVDGGGPALPPVTPPVTPP